jgi:hypothetical protein
MAFPKSGKTNPQREKPYPDQVSTLKLVTRRARRASEIRPIAAVAIGQIKPNPRNARTHSKKQIRQIADSIRAVGFAAPVLIVKPVPLRTQLSTNRRTAEDRLPCWRVLSISATIADGVVP